VFKCAPRFRASAVPKERWHLADEGDTCPSSFYINVQQSNSSASIIPKASMASRTFLPFLRPLPLPRFLPISARLVSTHPPLQQSIPPLTPSSLTRTYDLISLKHPPQKSRPPYKIPFHRYRTTYTEQHHSNYPYTT